MIQLRPRHEFPIVRDLALLIKASGYKDHFVHDFTTIEIDRVVRGGFLRPLSRRELARIPGADPQIDTVYVASQKGRRLLRKLMGAA